jgi:hypothetical protein
MKSTMGVFVVTSPNSIVNFTKGLLACLDPILWRHHRNGYCRLAQLFLCLHLRVSAVNLDEVPVNIFLEHINFRGSELACADAPLK